MGGWEPNYPNISLPPLHPQLRGAKLSIWSESPDLETEEQVADGIKDSLRGLAFNSWGAPKEALSFDDFVTRVINPLGRAPGY